MGKIKREDVEALRKAGRLSEAAITEMESSEVVSKGRRTTIKRFMKTADGKMVTPFMYFRGGQNAKPSKRMEMFTIEYNALVDKYTNPTTTINK